MRYFILNIYLLLFITIKSQNLVPNPSFENYSSCPNNYGQINNAISWTYLSAALPSDYYNSCSTSTNVSVPKNFFQTNYQISKSGNAYTGIQTIHPAGNFRSNVCTQLNTGLTLNNYYLVKFYIVNVQSYKIANNNLALNFSSTLTFTIGSGNTVNLPMHIYKFGNPVIKDTLNWTEVMGIYKANGTERYITIGNFKNDANTKMDTTNYGTIGYAAYYMIDDVSVEPICTPFWSYRDTTVTLGDSVLIGPAVTGLNINWYDATGTFITNAPGIYVKPNSPTFYTASEDFCNGITSHTINVMVTPTGVKEYNQLVNSFVVYPNPTKDKITITNTKFKTEEIEIVIIDLLGKKIILQESDKDTQGQILNLQNLDDGIYFLHLYLQGQLVVTKKIVKK